MPMLVSGVPEERLCKQTTMSLKKYVYSPGQWYIYFFVPPKLPEMINYFKQRETEFYRLFNFLPKDQIYGRILDSLGVPNSVGKINKSKLHKVFLFETSARGKKKMLQEKSRAKQAGVAPPKSTKLYEGPFKIFKSKNSRKLSSEIDQCERHGYELSMYDQNASKSSKEVGSRKDSIKISKKSDEINDQTCKARGSVEKPRAKEDTMAPVELSESDDSDVYFVPCSSKKPGTSKKLPQSKRPKIQMTVIRHRPRTTSPLWYENVVSSESSRSYSPESDEGLAPQPDAPSHIKNGSSRSDKNPVSSSSGTINGTSASNLRASVGAQSSKIHHILISDSDDGDLSIPVKHIPESTPVHDELTATSKVDKHLNWSDPLTTNAELCEPKNNQLLIAHGEVMPPIPSKSSLPDANSKDAADLHINAVRKKVEFKSNDDYYYYYKDSSSVTPRSIPSVWSSGSPQLMIDTSSDDNDYDTGIVSPVRMSQESQIMSQDSVPQTSVVVKVVPKVPRMPHPDMPLLPLHGHEGIESRDLRINQIDPWSAKVKPSPAVGKQTNPEARSLLGVAEELPVISSPPDQSVSLVPQNDQELRGSPSLSLGFSSAQPIITELGMLPPDLQLVGRIGSLRAEEENLSQISAATEIFSARVMVDLRTAGAYEAIQQHCRRIFEAVDSQNIFPATPKALSLTEQQPLLTPPVQNPNEDAFNRDSPRGQFDEQPEAPSSAFVFQKASQDEKVNDFHPRSPDIISSPENNMNSHVNMIDAQDEQPTLDNSTMSRTNNDEHALTTSTISSEQRMKLPFKKRLPILAAPKLKIITFNQLSPTTGDIANTKMASHRHSGADANTIGTTIPKQPNFQIESRAVDQQSSVVRVDGSWLSAGFEMPAIMNADASADECSSLARATSAGIKSLAKPANKLSSGTLTRPANAKSSSAASVKAASSNKSVGSGMASSVATNKAVTYQSLLATSVKTDQRNADKSNVVRHLGSKEDVLSDTRRNLGKVPAGSHSSKESLREWQRHATLAWKMSLPHITEQFFNDPNLVKNVLMDDASNRSGISWSEPSSRVKVQKEVKTRQDPPAQANPEGASNNLTDVSHKSDSDIGRLPQTPALSALSPFMRDLLFNASANPDKSVNSASIDPETQQRNIAAHANMDSFQLERNYSRDLESFIDASLASRSTLGRASVPENSCRPPQQFNRPLPSWWLQEYATPMQSFLEESESDSADSMLVILPRSQVQSDRALNPEGSSQHDDIYLPDLPTTNVGQQVSHDVDPNTLVRSSAVQTSVISRPSSENRPD